MTSSAPVPLTVLARHVSSRASGEFIAVGDELEVHVYLQAGRIAWGTTSEDRFVFRRHLVHAFEVDEKVLQEALLDCQHTRRPLGETLVQWGIVTLAQVKEALRAQVRSTLASLERCRGGQTLFLPRAQHYASYDTSLTFELEELTERAHE